MKKPSFAALRRSSTNALQGALQKQLNRQQHYDAVMGSSVGSVSNGSNVSVVSSSIASNNSSNNSNSSNGTSMHKPTEYTQFEPSKSPVGVEETSAVQEEDMLDSDDESEWEVASRSHHESRSTDLQVTDSDPSESSSRTQAQVRSWTRAQTDVPSDQPKAFAALPPLFTIHSERADRSVEDKSVSGRKHDQHRSTPPGSSSSSSSAHSHSHSRTPAERKQDPATQNVDQVVLPLNDTVQDPKDDTSAAKPAQSASSAPFRPSTIVPPSFICSLCKDVICNAVTLSCGCKASTVCSECYRQQNTCYCRTCSKLVDTAVPCPALDQTIECLLPTLFATVADDSTARAIVEWQQSFQQRKLADQLKQKQFRMARPAIQRGSSMPNIMHSPSHFKPLQRHSSFVPENPRKVVMSPKVTPVNQRNTLSKSHPVASVKPVFSSPVSNASANGNADQEEDDIMKNILTAFPLKKTSSRSSMSAPSTPQPPVFGDASQVFSKSVLRDEFGMDLSISKHSATRLQAFESDDIDVDPWHSNHDGTLQESMDSIEYSIDADHGDGDKNKTSTSTSSVNPSDATVGEDDIVTDDEGINYDDNTVVAANASSTSNKHKPTRSLRRSSDSKRRGDGPIADADSVIPDDGCREDNANDTVEDVTCSRQHRDEDDGSQEDTPKPTSSRTVHSSSSQEREKQFSVHTSHSASSSSSADAKKMALSHTAHTAHSASTAPVTDRNTPTSAKSSRQSLSLSSSLSPKLSAQRNSARRRSKTRNQDNPNDGAETGKRSESRRRRSAANRSASERHVARKPRGGKGELSVSEHGQPSSSARSQRNADKSTSRRRPSQKRNKSSKDDLAVSGHSTVTSASRLAGRRHRRQSQLTTDTSPKPEAIPVDETLTAKQQEIIRELREQRRRSRSLSVKESRRSTKKSQPAESKMSSPPPSKSGVTAIGNDLSRHKDPRLSESLRQLWEDLESYKPTMTAPSSPSVSARQLRPSPEMTELLSMLSSMPSTAVTPSKARRRSRVGPAQRVSSLMRTPAGKKRSSVRTARPKIVKALSESSLRKERSTAVVED